MQSFFSTDIEAYGQKGRKKVLDFMSEHYKKHKDLWYEVPENGYKVVGETYVEFSFVRHWSDQNKSFPHNI